MPQDFDVQEVLQLAQDEGFYGFGGRCGWAAIAINRVLFDGKAEMVGAFNTAFWGKDAAIGHVAVFHDGVYWDSDATPKPFEDIESWGMLDEHDPDYRDRARELNIEWPAADEDGADQHVAEDHPAYGVTKVALTEKQILEQFPDDIGMECATDGGIAEMEEILREVLQEHLAARQPAPAA